MIQTSDEKYNIHKYCNIIPRPTQLEINNLVESMKEDGFRIENPIVLDEDGSILDGWSRYEAALIAEVIPTFRDYDPEVDGNKICFVRRENLDRRMLTTDAHIKAYLDLAKETEDELIEKALEAIQDEPEEFKKAVIKAKKKNTNKQIAEIVGVEEKRVKQVRKAIEKVEKKELTPDIVEHFNNAMDGKGRGRPTIKSVNRKIEGKEIAPTKTVSKEVFDELKEIAEDKMNEKTICPKCGHIF